jgi:mannosyltransferase OCH1-like enzyme
MSSSVVVCRHFSKIYYFLVALLFVCTGCKETTDSSSKKGQPAHTIMEVDFDEAMGKGSSDYEVIFKNEEDVKRYLLFKKLYEKNLPSKIEKSSTPKIPKIIHQIWLGPKTPPPYFYTFREKWKTMHPDWEYRLWTDESLDELPLELRDLIQASPNYAERSDILRSELLALFGGVYIDVDMDPHYALDDLHAKYDFYIGVEHPHQIATTPNRVWGGISIMAAVPKHPVILRWKEYIRARWNEVNDTYSSPVERVINHTYFPFTFALMDKLEEGNYVNMTFPATYFYPLTSAAAAKRKSTFRSIREKFYDVLEKMNLKSARAFSKVYPETIATHYWGNTWLDSNENQIKALQQQLNDMKKELALMKQKLSSLEKKQSEPIGMQQGKTK